MPQPQYNLSVSANGSSDLTIDVRDGNETLGWIVYDYELHDLPEHVNDDTIKVEGGMFLHLFQSNASFYFFSHSRRFDEFMSDAKRVAAAREYAIKVVRALRAIDPVIA